MITFFSCPKSFDEQHIGIIQRNAILSWLKQTPTPEIILLGDDNGIEEICNEYNLVHIPEIAKNSKGTPLVNSIFDKAKEKASNDILCYINADIILFDDFTMIIKDIIKKINKDYLIVGQRTDMDIVKPIEFNDVLWQDMLRKKIEKKGVLHGATGKDFFVFTKEFFKNIPPFAIGRGMWDDWFLFYARSNKKKVIDVTHQLTIVHQNHDYVHIKSKEKISFVDNEEWETNVLLSGGISHSYTLDDANYYYMDNKLLRKSNLLLLRRLLYHID